MNVKEWTTDSNVAIELSLVTRGPTEPTTLHSFHPKFTYPFFGESESIFGYRGLKIRLRFAAHDLRPHLDIAYESKVKPQGVFKPEDVASILKEHLPEGTIYNSAEFDDRIQKFDYQSFTPPGKLFTTYELDGRTFEIWVAPLTDARCKEIFSNVEIMAMFFIEGASKLDYEEMWTRRRWDVYFLYEKAPGSMYQLAGYCNLYRYWYSDFGSRQDKDKGPAFAPELICSTYPDTEPDPFPCRARISQFHILPPHQSQGHGSRFYDAIFGHLYGNPLVREITVEDPSDAFNDLRDLRDLSRLHKQGVFVSLSINKYSTYRFHQFHLQSKLPKLQFTRCVELAMLSELDKTDTATYEKYKAIVKKRLFKVNKEVLMGLDKAMREDQLDVTYFHMEDEYTRILLKFEEGPPTAGPAGGSGSDRRVDSDEEMGSDGDHQGGRAKKRARK